MRPPEARTRPFDLSRILFYIVTRGGLIGLVFFLGVRAGAVRTAAYFFWADLIADVRASLRLTVTEAPTLTGVRPTHFLNPARYEGEGVTVNDESTNPTDLILLGGFFEDSNEVRLLHRDGRIVARWPVTFVDLFPSPDFIPPGQVPLTNWNVDIHGAIAVPDGSVILNFENSGSVRLDRCNNVMWTLRRQTHHSVERAGAGGFWIPGRRWVTDESPYVPFEAPFKEDLVLRVSDDGVVRSEFSVVKLLYDNGLGPVLTATGHLFEKGMRWDGEIVHLNKVDELTADLAPDFPMFSVGDLVLSIRELNMLLVVDPAGTTVKWWQVGPWLRQHDPSFVHGGRILVFNNNTFRSDFPRGDDSTPADTPRVSTVMTVDPATRRTDVVYGGRPGQDVLSVIRGKVAMTPSGGLLITEPDGGRVREIDSNGRVVWEYVNRYDEADAALVTQAALYPADYFTFDTGTWTCEGR